MKTRKELYYIYIYIYIYVDCLHILFLGNNLTADERCTPLFSKVGVLPCKKVRGNTAVEGNNCFPPPEILAKHIGLNARSGQNVEFFLMFNPVVLKVTTGD